MQGIVIIAIKNNKRYALKCVGILNNLGKEDKRIL